MYLGKREIFDPAKHEHHRANVIGTKSGAVWNAFVELEGLINKTQLADQYFNRSQAWLSQKLNGCTLHNHKKEFTEKEFHQLAQAFRHIARRLEAHADEIDAAAIDDPDNAPGT
ncbi:MAG: DUF5053 domain-containing protein [Muribaculaceae bacterium]|nr:DUF5053 domain-containing protein [Muribaculaceae bacterium]